MKNRRHSPEQIIRKLAEGDKLLNQGQAATSRSPSRPGIGGSTSTAA
jgi:hypothetical protein